MCWLELIYNVSCNWQDVGAKRKRELLIRLIYVEMLGHDAGFGYIHAVNLAQEKGLKEKRVGWVVIVLAFAFGVGLK